MHKISLYKFIFLSLFLFTATVVSAAKADVELLAEQARSLSQAFAKQLKSQLQAGMHDGGPLLALDVCNLQAPAIADAVAEGSGWKVARTSLKARQEDNRPDEWELMTLLDFEKQKAGGASPATIEHYEIFQEENSRVFRYMHAIPTAEVCLACHGQKIKPEVLVKINELYPMDQATGFKAGDLRGAFTMSKQLD